MKAGLICTNLIKSKRKIAVLGDMLELGDFSEKLHRDVGKLFENLNFDILYLIGKNAKYIAQEAKNYMSDSNIRVYSDNKILANVLKLEMKEGDLIYFKASNGMKFNEIIDFIK